MRKAKPRRNGKSRPPYVARAREYDTLLEKLEIDEADCEALFDFAPRTSRRYRRGDGKLPLSVLKLLRLMARGKLTKRQVANA